MEKINKVDALKLCIQLWETLSDRNFYESDGWCGTTDEKNAALRLMGYTPEHVLHSCFACEYSLQIDRSLYPDSEDNEIERNCRFCPINAWASNNRNAVTCLDPDQSYSAWREAETIEEACKHAQEIVRLAQESLHAL